MSATTTVAPPVTVPVDEPPPRRRRTVVLVVVLVLALAAGAAWFLLLRGPDLPEGTEAPDGVIVALDPLTTTVGRAALRHARVAMAVVLSERADPAAVTDRAPLLQDALLREVARMDADQLRSSEGSDLLRDHLTEVAQEIWDDGQVKRVVLTELLVQ